MRCVESRRAGWFSVVKKHFLGGVRDRRTEGGREGGRRGKDTQGKGLVQTRLKEAGDVIVNAHSQKSLCWRSVVD